MKTMERFCSIVEEELGKIAEKGLNTGNLETAYKLIDMYKDLKNTEYWDIKSDYYMAVLEEMTGGYSQGNHGMNDGYSERGRKRDSMGRYSREGMEYSRNNYENENSYMHDGRGYSRRRYGHDGNSYAGGGGYSGNYDRYMESKQSYRSSKSPECKQRLMENLEQYMDDFSQRMEEMLRDSDCQEERATIKRYIDKIKNIN